MFALRPAQLALAQVRRDGGRHAQRDAVLQVEQFGELAVESVGPDDAGGRHLAQLDGDPQRFARTAHAAMQHIADVELIPDTAQIERRPGEADGRAARDHQQVFQAAQGADDVVDHPFREIGIRLVLLQGAERQYRERRPVFAADLRCPCVRGAHAW